MDSGLEAGPGQQVAFAVERSDGQGEAVLLEDGAGARALLECAAHDLEFFFQRGRSLTRSALQMLAPALHLWREQGKHLLVRGGFEQLPEYRLGAAQTGEQFCILGATWRAQQQAEEPER